MEEGGQFQPQLEEDYGVWDMLMSSYEEDEGPGRTPPHGKGKTFRSEGSQVFHKSIL